MSWLGYAIAVLAGAAIGVLAVHRRRPVGTDSIPPTRSERPELAAVALEHSVTGHVIVDAQGRVHYANPRAIELGVVRAGVAEPAVVAAAARASANHQVVDIELVPRARPGEPVRRGPLAVHAAVRSIGDGLLLVAASDDTEAARLEAVRRDFVANVSHELKTPVAAITLLTEAILDAPDEPDVVRRFASRLEHESTRLATMVGELIMLSRLQGADPLPDLAVVEVDELITDAVHRSATVAERAEIALVVAPPGRLQVLGDPEMLVVALTNLIENAVHYSGSGTTVSISSAGRQDLVDIAVTDRGLGIAAEFQDRVFERFFRVDPARSRATGGTGLGLAIVKHVAANHGGSALVWSRPGTGSTFTLRLPAYQPDRIGAPAPSMRQAFSG